MMPIGSVRAGVRGRRLPDEAEVPDSAIAQYDATKLSLNDGDAVLTWPDAVNDNDLAANGNPLYQSNVQNGNPVVRGDGADDFLDVDIPNVSAPFTFAIVIPTADQSDDFRPMYRSDSQHASTGFFWDGRWRFISNGNTSDNGGSTSPPVILLGYQKSNGDVVIRENGTETSRDNESLGQVESIELFSRDDGVEIMDGDIGEALVYNSDLEADGDLYYEEQRLSDKWGITL